MIIFDLCIVKSTCLLRIKNIYCKKGPNCIWFVFPWAMWFVWLHFFGVTIGDFPNTSNIAPMICRRSGEQRSGKGAHCPPTTRAMRRTGTTAANQNYHLPTEKANCQSQKGPFLLHIILKCKIRCNWMIGGFICWQLQFRSFEVENNYLPSLPTSLSLHLTPKKNLVVWVVPWSHNILT